MFRSVDMSYVQVLLPTECAESFVDRMARDGQMQFTDLNEDFQPFQRQYTGDIIAIQEVERQIKTIEEILKEYNINFDTVIMPHELQSVPRQTNVAHIIETISRDVRDAHVRLSDQATAERQLRNELSIQEALITVLSQLEKMISAPVVEDRLADASRDVGFRYFAGVVSIGQRVAFERQIFLTSRGNSFVQFDEANQNDLTKVPFVVFYLGDQLQRSLKRLCQFMNIQICYESESPRSREELLAEATAKRNDFARIHMATKNQLSRDMKDTGKRLRGWKISLIQEKSIRITLNKFQTRNNMLRAEGWVPTSKRDNVQRILDEVTTNKGINVHAILTEQKPKGIIPTHFEETVLTAPFQAIVNTYGVPRYKEFNPAIPTIVTFPFLFGVMYGDIFHGSWLFLAGIFGVFGTKYYYSPSSRSAVAQGLYGARYILFLMGFFALYCGLVYNDCMSITINGWNHTQWKQGQTHHDTTVYIQKGVYYFGIDPSWGGAANQLAFENSLKMKLSIIIGVTQMTFGLFLKLSNHIQEDDWISVFCEFVPQFIFMMVFFGYMVFLIVFKWCLKWGTLTNLHATPSLITVLIKMVLSPGSLDDTTTMYDQTTQKKVQVAFILLMVISVPWMLIPKIILLKRKHQQKMARQRAIDHEADIENRGNAPRGGPELLHEESEEKTDDITSPQQHAQHGHGHEGEEFEMSEVFIHQLIHTIEYVLGTVSNTASYLRLWALSLAHAQLSEVFYSKTIQSSLGGTGPLSVVESVLTCFLFLMFTLGVLLMMDVLECFLHALRLHWVEFQNKFFYADGVAFEGFTYALALKET